MMPKSPWGEDTLVLVRDGILTGASVNWLVKRDRWEGRLRRIQSSGLQMFSIVDSPAYAEATVSARAKEYLEGLEVTARPATRLIQLQ